MGKTKIEWCTHSENFVAGCTEAGPECDNCYARIMSARLGTMSNKPARYDGITTGHGADAKWTGEINLDMEAMFDAFIRLSRRREPARVFLGSMTDLFHAKVPRDFLFNMLVLIKDCPQHAFLLLTKRSRRMRRVIEQWSEWYGVIDPLPNLWCGVTAGDQAGADRRIPDLLRTPAAVRFVSVEPMLGPVDLDGYLGGLQWVIVGGESGRQARPMRHAWATSLRDQCAAAGVAFHFKQWGEWCPARADELPSEPWRDPNFHVHENTPDHIVVSIRAGKKLAGRHLDGRTHDELPAAWPVLP